MEGEGEGGKRCKGKRREKGKLQGLGEENVKEEGKIMVWEETAGEGVVERKVKRRDRRKETLRGREMET